MRRPTYEDGYRIGYPIGLWIGKHLPLFIVRWWYGRRTNV